MSKDILDEYGPNSAESQAARATTGGVKVAKPLPYSPPLGPKGLSQSGPGLGGGNCGQCGTQGKY